MAPAAGEFMDFVVVSFLPANCRPGVKKESLTTPVPEEGSLITLSGGEQ
jgi:hypothetical protein